MPTDANLWQTCTIKVNNICEKNTDYRFLVNLQYTSTANSNLRLCSFICTCNLTSNLTSVTWSSVLGRDTWRSKDGNNVFIFTILWKLVRYKKYYCKCRWMNHRAINTCCGDGVSLTFVAVMQCLLIFLRCLEPPMSPSRWLITIWWLINGGH